MSQQTEKEEIDKIMKAIRRKGIDENATELYAANFLEGIGIDSWKYEILLDVTKDQLLPVKRIEGNHHIYISPDGEKYYAIIPRSFAIPYGIPTPSMEVAEKVFDAIKKRPAFR